MTPAARLSAAMACLDDILAGDPAAMVLTNWSRRSRFAGSRDRAAVRDIVYDCLRRRRSYGAIGGADTGRGLVIAHAVGAHEDWPALFSGEGYGPAPLSPQECDHLADPVEMSEAERLNVPDFLIAPLRRSLGDAMEPVLTAMADRAPVDLRVNRLRGDLAAAQASLQADGIVTVPVADVPTALRVVENPRQVNQSAAYRSGLVELQDASSQAVALFAQARPGMAVLDYCAGGGGKALALYDAIGGAGHVVAHDVAAVRMNDLPARAARAKARISVAQPGHALLQPGGFDLVFVDAPCSGSGSWRRTPDAKWRIRPRDLDNLDTVQADILGRAAAFVKPGGALVYATCSVLRRENDDRIDRFLADAGSFVEADRAHFTPLTGGDGFFVCRAIRTE